MYNNIMTLEKRQCEKNFKCIIFINASDNRACSLDFAFPATLLSLMLNKFLSHIDIKY